MKETVVDKYGNEVYLTDERWQHIVEQHPDMENYKQYLFKTLRDGKRKQHRLQPQTFIYSRRFDDLADDMTHVIVIVKFGFESKRRIRTPNNFVLTAYQKKVYTRK